MQHHKDRQRSARGICLPLAYYLAVRSNHWLRFHANACLLALSFVATSCVYENISPDTAVKGDYFPLTEGNRWKYVTKYICPGPDRTKPCTDTAEYFAGGDPLSWNEQYKPMSAVYGTFKWIRKVNNEYYTMGAYQPEYKFLDTNLGLGGGWTNDNGYEKQEFSIVTVNGTKTIERTTYRNVIEVLVVTSWKNAAGSYEEISREHHFYAKGVGEIYSWYPANEYNDAMETILIDYFIHP